MVAEEKLFIKNHSKANILAKPRHPSGGTARHTQRVPSLKSKQHATTKHVGRNCCRFIIHHPLPPASSTFLLGNSGVVVYKKIITTVLVCNDRP